MVLKVRYLQEVQNLYEDICNNISLNQIGVLYETGGLQYFDPVDLAYKFRDLSRKRKDVEVIYIEWDGSVTLFEGSEKEVLSKLRSLLKTIRQENDQAGI